MPLILIPFGVLAAGLFLLAYTHTASVHQGAATTPKRSGGILGALTFVLPVLAPLEKGVKRAVDWAINSVRGWVSHWALAHVKAVARWFVGLNLLAQRVAREQSGLATDTATALEKIAAREKADTRYKDGTHVKTRATTALNTAHTALARERALRSTVTAEHRAQVKLNVHYTHAIDVALPRYKAGVRTRVGTLEREYDGLKQRTKALEDGAIDTFKYLSAHRTTAAMGVFAGAVSWALARLGYGFLRCNSWRNLGRRATCGTASTLLRLLDDGLGAFAGALFTYEAVTNLRTLVEIGQTVEKDVASSLHDLLEL